MIAQVRKDYLLKTTADLTNMEIISIKIRKYLGMPMLPIINITFSITSKVVKQENKITCINMRKEVKISLFADAIIAYQEM